MAKTTESIGGLIRRLEDGFINGGGVLSSKYVTSDAYEDISKIYAYLDSKHISGSTDSQGREKPFFNICIAARNIWYRATDIDRKNINVRATKLEDVTPALFATAKLQDWMRRENFGQFLNDWGLELAGFNSAVVKFVEQGDGLHSMVVPWSRLIFDPIDFANNPKIEILELTEAQLYQRKGYDKKQVKALCEAKQARQTTDGSDKDTKNDYIKLYEIHGNLPLSYLTDDEDDDYTYVQQMHVVSFVAGKEKGTFDDFTLISGQEARDPYMLTSLLPATDGSVSFNGSVKNLFDAQWMQNHSVKAIKDALDISSKIAFQTSDPRFVGKNILSDFDYGQVFVHEVNQPLTQLNNGSHDTTAIQNFQTMWKNLSNEINGISEAMLGANPPSGSAWRQTEAMLQESHSLFEEMTENKGLAIEQMLRKFVIPYFKKQLDNKDEVRAVLDSAGIKKIDEMYIPKAAAIRHIQMSVEELLGGGIPPAYDAETEEGAYRQDMAQLGNQRFLAPGDITWKEVFKDLEWELEVDVTGEARDMQQVMTTLNTALQVLVNPAFSQNPKAQFVVDKILMASGIISPAELSSLPPAPTPSPMQPQMVGGE